MTPVPPPSLFLLGDGVAQQFQSSPHCMQAPLAPEQAAEAAEALEAGTDPQRAAAAAPPVQDVHGLVHHNQQIAAALLRTLLPLPRVRLRASPTCSPSLQQGTCAVCKQSSPAQAECCVPHWTWHINASWP